MRFTSDESIEERERFPAKVGGIVNSQNNHTQVPFFTAQTVTPSCLPFPAHPSHSGNPSS